MASDASSAGIGAAGCSGAAAGRAPRSSSAGAQPASSAASSIACSRRVLAAISSLVVRGRVLPRCAARSQGLRGDAGSSSRPGGRRRSNAHSVCRAMPAPAASRQVAAIEREIDAARRSGPLREIVVPPCPELLTRLQMALASGEPDLNEVARIANADVAMAATLIRNANGAAFAASSPVASAGQAMNRLGLKQSVALMNAFLVRHAIPSTTRCSAASGISRRAAPARSPGSPRSCPVWRSTAHSYGLFCHVGLPVLMQSVRGYAGTLVEARARKDRSHIETENANHRTDHAVVGALTARAWRLAPSVMAAIRLHHSLESLGSSDTEPEVHTLVAAGPVADYLLAHRAGLSPGTEWEQHGADACAWLAISGDDLHHWQETLADIDGEVLTPA
ncbi:HDOD domain-containing protein [Piscinibacter aquaticus]|uniref:HDOD domain-containing protein n=1 Tax=Piscinibacter aquaticus TaxID=392597 RepID=A0A5C6U5U3_9BURK|nr:HDOD domain-containing protein [Piscinibacter aquaticus]